MTTDTTSPVEKVPTADRLPAPRRSELDGPVWFGPDDTPLLGWVHRPRTAVGGSVVLCSTLFGEGEASHAAYRRLAQRLAKAGLFVVRFDYPGTGDSAGLPQGADVVPSWIGAIDHAIELARDVSAGGPVGLVGMRMGAVLATLAAERRSDVEALVLWDPCDSGRAFLRRQQSLHLLHYGRAEDGKVEVPGAALDERTAAAISRLRLPRTAAAKSALVLVRPEGTAPACQHVAAAVEVATLAPGEQEDLLEVEHLLRRLPEAGIEQIAGWLATALAGPVPDRPRRPADDDVWRRPAALAADHGVVRDPGGGAPVLERVRWLGPAGLFSVESVPADPGVPLRRQVVVFLPEGFDRHTGTSDLWVSLARRWAPAGFRCLRVDFSGLGESPARPGSQEQGVRLPEAFDDVADLVRWAAPDPRDVVLVGLCSGAYQALEGAVAHDLGGVLAINPVLRFLPPEAADGGKISPRRQVCEARPPWVTALRARVQGPLRRVVAVASTLRGRLRPVLERRGHAQRRLGWQQALVGRGVRAYCLCGPDEGQPLVGAYGPELRTAASGGRLEVDVVDDLDHALLRASDRATVTERLTEQLQRLAAER